MRDPLKVRFLPAGREARVSRGAYLTAAAVRAAVVVVHDCDGQGVCGTCRVEVVEGADHLSPLDPRERDQLGGAVQRGWRLCCLARALGDVTLRVPEGFAYPPETQRER